ncbi:glutamine--scyllo-inositol aminotransferase [Sphingobacteriaceae bacterium]|nr:glutamine--scyllo-inositol aminotransferase [Sphingobacteriaceae bacterium]
MNFIPLAKPNIIEKDIDLVVEVLRSGMLVQGKYAAELEKSFIKLSGTKYASALSNGTATLHLALRSLDIKEGDEVIVPAFSYVATANVVELVGAKPVFVDIDLKTFNIDTTKIEDAITSRTKAIMPVHEFGLACDMDAVMNIAKKHKLYVIEDAACALGALYKNKHVGSFGEFGSFSLHPRKAISSGEGGVLITSNEELDKKIKILRNHGTEIIDGKMEFSEFGFNYRMTDFQAALVYSQMDRLQTSIDYKNELADIYFSEIKSQKIALPFIPDYTKHTWQTFHVVVDETIDRDDLINKLKDKNIGVNYGAQCIPFMNVYKDKYNLDCKNLFPNALRAYQKGLALPIYDLVTKEQINYITTTLNNIIS